MFIADCDANEIKREVQKLLKCWGVKHRIKKIHIKNELKKDVGGVFKIHLEKLEQKRIQLRQYDQCINIPAFVVESCCYIRENIETEGLFRKPGLALRQKKLKNFLENGGHLTEDNGHNVLDVADLLKLFFRDLPEPCIPYAFHDILQRCLELGERRTDAILLTLLMLPTTYLYTLAYLMQLLYDVADHCINRMDITNLVIVWTPNLMPYRSGHGNIQNILQKNLIIVQILIENYASIGVVPEYLCEHLSIWHQCNSLSSHDDHENSNVVHCNNKKKRRSGSLTRMLNGIKKMVGGKSVSQDESQVSPAAAVAVPLTPRIMSSAQKRKTSGSALPSALSAKKRRGLLESLPQAQLLPDLCPSNLTPCALKSQREGTKRSRRSLSSSRLQFSHFTLGGKQRNKTTMVDDSETPTTLTPNILDMSTCSDSYVRISKKELEDIKNRVSIIESRISSEIENIVGISISDLEMTPERPRMESVQSVYERTLESAENLRNPKSDELARMISKELKIHGSSEKKVIRSPSARKIGSIRRRSREYCTNLKRSQSSTDTYESTSCHQFPTINYLYKDNSKTDSFSHSNQVALAKPNDIMHRGLFEYKREDSETGDPTELDSSSFGVLTRSQARKTSSLNGCDFKKASMSPFGTSRSSSIGTTVWKDAEDFLTWENDGENIITGRPSLAELRSHNAGQVLAKAKLFNTMMDTNYCFNVDDFNNSDKKKSREIKKKRSSKKSNDCRPLVRRRENHNSRQGPIENHIANKLLKNNVFSPEISKKESQYAQNGKQQLLQFYQNTKRGSKINGPNPIKAENCVLCKSPLKQKNRCRGTSRVNDYLGNKHSLTKTLRNGQSPRLIKTNGVMSPKKSCRHSSQS